MCPGSPEEREECEEFGVYRAWAVGGLSFTAQSQSETEWALGDGLQSRKTSRWCVEVPDGSLGGEGRGRGGIGVGEGRVTITGL